MNNGILLILFGGLGTAIVVAIFRKLLSSKAQTSDRMSMHGSSKKETDVCTQISNNLSVKTQASSPPHTFGMYEFLNNDTYSDLSTQSDISIPALKKSMFSNFPSVAKKNLSMGSLLGSSLNFDPKNTKITDLGDGGGMISDPNKFLVSKPKENIKIGVFNPLRLPCSYEETDDEIIIRIRKSFATQYDWKNFLGDATE